MLLAVCVAAAKEPVADAPSAGEGEAKEPDFNRDVLPVLQQYCVGCHSKDDPERGLVLESYESLLKGSEGGAVLFPGKADQSRLLLVLDGRTEPAMPPEGNEKPTAEEIARLKAWIAGGAKSPTGEPPDPTLLVTPQVPLLEPARRVINAAAITTDGTLAALAGYQEVRLVATQSGATKRVLAGHRGNVTNVAFSSDGTRLAAAAGEPGLFGEVRVWNVADGALLQTLVGHTDSLYGLAFSPDGAWIASGSYDQRVILWDASTGAQIRTLEGHNGAVFELAFNTNGRLLASASGDRTVKLWDAANGARLDTFGQSLKEIYSVAFSPDGRQVAAGGVDNRIRVWQISETGQEGTNPIVYSRFAHEGAIIKLAFSPDGKSLASSAEDRTVRIWNTESYTERVLLAPQPDWATALVFSSDSKRLLVGRLDGTTAWYDSQTGQVVPPAPPELAALQPRGIQRGVATRIKFSGKNLLGATDLKFSDQSFTSIAVVPDQELAEETWFEVTPGVDLPRGTYRVSLTTAGGTTAELPLEVDDLPQLIEAEPNDTAAQAAALSLPAGQWGLLSSKGDVDHTAFEARAGQTIVCELSAKRLGSPVGGSLALVNALGQVVATSNGFDGQQDPILAYRVPADGRYVARVHDLSRNGSGDHFYRLSIGELPYVLASHPLSIPANQPAEVELTGYNVPEGTKAAVDAGPAGERPLAIDLARFRVVRPLTVLAVEGPQALEAEPNDEPPQATPIAAPGFAAGRFRPSNATADDDVDLFRFESRAAQSWIIETEAERRGSPADTRIEVLDAAGNPVERMRLQAVRDSYIEFRGVDSNAAGLRPKNWEEMELNEYMYIEGEICKVFRMPQGPDSEIQFYTVGGKRRCFFDTSATAHPLDATVYTVQLNPPGSQITPNGLPVFPLHFSNDDDGDRRLGRDSRVTFTAPADGTYLVRVSDVRGLGGDTFGYRLNLREPRPGFTVTLADMNATVHAGSGRRLSFNADRRDGFDGEISIQIEGLPPGYSVTTPLVIEAGHTEARAVLAAAPDASAASAEDWGKVTVTASAQVNDNPVAQAIGTLGNVTLAEKPNIMVHLEPAELVIAPGTTIEATLKVERNGFEDLVTFDVDNLPHGVIVDNIGLNGVLIPAGQSERQIYLKAAKWVPQTSRPFHAVANNAGGQASASVVLHVRPPDSVAQAPSP